ncbi:hypothetical protein [Celeribacter litoreus]|uniref:hypothetical protein n=1 Tax=Celeribacter litoreus TaxID=2876714 RepID=UPI001CC9BE13|nr:hypothetical protein [Celeribacter litoreus]MCA0042195.1 hypothetical protein [Celeribacter litoreus]
MSGQSDEENWEEFWDKLELEEFEDGLDRDRWRLGLLIDVLAWVCRQKGRDIAEIDLDGWPDGFEVWHDEKLAALAMKDPRIFQAARLQVSDIFHNFACEYRHPEELSPENWKFFRKILTQDAPPTRGPSGDHLARDVLICQIFYWASEDADWVDGFGEAYRVTKYSHRLSEELNKHPILSECDAAVLSPETIRAVLKKGDGDFGWIKPRQLLSDLEWPED